MIPALEAAGFFLAITAALQFSNWAEGWLSSTSRSKKERAFDGTSAAAAQRETVRAA